MNSSSNSAKDIMSHKLIFIDGLDTAANAIEKMKSQGVDALIINKRNQNDAYGIVTIKDIIKKVYIKDLKPEEVNIYEIMSKPVIPVPALMNIRYISRLMLRAKISVAPVEQDGELIGVISFSSLFHNGLY
ncbi:CBS domain-containing protein [Aquiflexum sp. LQ15W]|uniref:CBS domain-containing protein n=1 Tax=Cognataquiflexum nitidum TaxID=2922272 RepID=UPI001F130784|nr:CBS domain-containing protein [Cognataquiflexum nitidum]MCH6201858.1 CBS domain-containing protein [Cognataquiflexum nitidum]